ncbi:MAG TPA: hypothetical protein VNA18_04400 [Nitrososphaeraceae archaeon]|nr:hypothetical protein [Nitrososphaeraceae archaeon]
MLLASLAITFLKNLLRSIAACPFSVAQSPARFFWGVTVFKNSNNELVSKKNNSLETGKL